MAIASSSLVLYPYNAHSPSWLWHLTVYEEQRRFEPDMGGYSVIQTATYLRHLTDNQ